LPAFFSKQRLVNLICIFANLKKIFTILAVTLIVFVQFGMAEFIEMAMNISSMEKIEKMAKEQKETEEESDSEKEVSGKESLPCNIAANNLIVAFQDCNKKKKGIVITHNLLQPVNEAMLRPPIMG
jgi:hypothetical protein